MVVPSVLLSGIGLLLSASNNTSTLHTANNGSLGGSFINLNTYPRPTWMPGKPAVKTSKTPNGLTWPTTEPKLENFGLWKNPNSTTSQYKTYNSFSANRSTPPRIVSNNTYVGSGGTIVSGEDTEYPDLAASRKNRAVLVPGHSIFAKGPYSVRISEQQSAPVHTHTTPPSLFAQAPPDFRKVSREMSAPRSAESFAPKAQKGVGVGYVRPAQPSSLEQSREWSDKSYSSREPPTPSYSSPSVTPYYQQETIPATPDHDSPYHKPTISSVASDRYYEKPKDDLPKTDYNQYYSNERDSHTGSKYYGTEDGMGAKPSPSKDPVSSESWGPHESHTVHPSPYAEDRYMYGRGHSMTTKGYQTNPVYSGGHLTDFDDSAVTSPSIRNVEGTVGSYAASGYGRATYGGTHGGADFYQGHDYQEDFHPTPAGRHHTGGTAKHSGEYYGSDAEPGPHMPEPTEPYGYSYPQTPGYPSGPASKTSRPQSSYEFSPFDKEEGLPFAKPHGSYSPHSTAYPSYGGSHMSSHKGYYTDFGPTPQYGGKGREQGYGSYDADYGYGKDKDHTKYAPDKSGRRPTNHKYTKAEKEPKGVEGSYETGGKKPYSSENHHPEFSSEKYEAFPSKPSPSGKGGNPADYGYPNEGSYPTKTGNKSPEVPFQKPGGKESNGDMEDYTVDHIDHWNEFSPGTVRGNSGGSSYIDEFIHQFPPFPSPLPLRSGPASDPMKSSFPQSTYGAYGPPRKGKTNYYQPSTYPTYRPGVNYNSAESMYHGAYPSIPPAPHSSPYPKAPYSTPSYSRYAEQSPYSRKPYSYSPDPTPSYQGYSEQSPYSKTPNSPHPTPSYMGYSEQSPYSKRPYSPHPTPSYSGYSESSPYSPYPPKPTTYDHSSPYHPPYDQASSSPYQKTSSSRSAYDPNSYYGYADRGMGKPNQKVIKPIRTGSKMDYGNYDVPNQGYKSKETSIYSAKAGKDSVKRSPDR